MVSEQTHTSTKATRVMIVEDHAIVLEGLTILIDDQHFPRLDVANEVPFWFWKEFGSTRT